MILVVAGTDETANIVKEKRRKYGDKIVLIEEENRSGQSSAQNKIFENVEGDLFFFLDGDGVIREGSLELMISRYNGSSILHGREIPIKKQTFLSKVIWVLWDIHHKSCIETPKFSTQLGLVPSELLYPIPEDIILDDEFIAVRAVEEGYGVEYVPEAVKYHNTSNRLKYYLAQREKNWAGLFQLDRRGHSSTVDNKKRTKIFFNYFKKADTKTRFYLLVFLSLELVGLARAYKDRFLLDWPVIWDRE